MTVNGRRAVSSVIALIVAVAAVGTGWAVAPPATAAAITATVGDLTYWVDDADPGTGAMVTGYVGTDTAVTVPQTVTIEGESYAVTSIGTDAFKGKGLTAVDLPDTLTSIGWASFENNQLTEIDIPDAVANIGSYAFKRNALTRLTMPSSVTGIGFAAFEANALSSVALPETVTGIESYAFKNNKLTELTIPDTVTTINLAAFEGNSLTKLTIPASVNYIGAGAFKGNPLLTVRFAGDAPEIVEAGGNGSFGHSASKILYYSSAATGFTTPEWNGYTTATATVTYAVSFAAGEGQGVPGVTVAHGDTVPRPDDPVRPAYTFTGWYVDPDATMSYDFALPVTADMTLYAGWEPAPPAPGPNPPTPSMTATTLTTANLIQVYGMPATLAITVAPNATGAVRVTAGSTALTAPLSDGRATVVLPAKVLAPGRHALTISYPGHASGFLPSTASVSLRVVKATPTVRVKKVTKKVLRGRKAVLKVRVRAAHLRPTGKVTVKLGGKARTVTLKRGNAKVRVRAAVRPGVQKVRVIYRGDRYLAKAKAKPVKIRVVR